MLAKNWTRDELILAFNLYCKLPFGQCNHRNADVIALANLIGRTPAAVAMKLGNFASFDPHHKARGVGGLPNVGKLDRAIWDEFHQEWNRLVPESEQLFLRAIERQPKAANLAKNIPSQSVLAEMLLAKQGLGTSAKRMTTVRLGQQFFRRVILTSYGCKCSVCGNPVADLLVASHILPWSDYAHLRLDPYNGLCLCSIHDRAFDAGLISFNPEKRMMLSIRIKGYIPNRALESQFVAFEGKSISLPEKFAPRDDYFAIHRERYFAQKA